MRIMRERGIDAAARLIHAVEATCDACADDIDVGFTLLAEAVGSGKTIYACGNGGSSATAAHFIAELVGRYKIERGPLRAVALGSCLSTITAIGNDYGYGSIFSRELRGLACEGDVLIAFSTSGKSPNVLEALYACQEIGVRTIILTGANGVHSSASADCVIAVPNTETARIQEVHDLIIHIWCEALDAHITKEDD